MYLGFFSNPHGVKVYIQAQINTYTHLNLKVMLKVKQNLNLPRPFNLLLVVIDYI